MDIRRERFVDAYLATGIGKEAALAAGYSAARADVTASELLRVPEVAESIRERRQRLAEAAGVRAEDAIRGILEVARTSRSDREKLRAWALLLEMVGMLGPVREVGGSSVDARSVTINVTDPDQFRRVLELGLASIPALSAPVGVS